MDMEVRDTETVIRVEGLQKRYRLGVIGGGTLSEDVSAWWAKVRGKPDPRIPIDQENLQVRHGAAMSVARRHVRRLLDEVSLVGGVEFSRVTRRGMIALHRRNQPPP